jgi:hypothetical protein
MMISDFKKEISLKNVMCKIFSAFYYFSCVYL